MDKVITYDEHGNYTSWTIQEFYLKKGEING